MLGSWLLDTSLFYIEGYPVPHLALGGRTDEIIQACLGCRLVDRTRSDHLAGHVKLMV